MGVLQTKKNDISSSHFKNLIQKKLENQTISSKALLARSRFLDGRTDKSIMFNDPRYLPFYYYLGTLYHARNVIEFGVGLGLPTACFAQGRRGAMDHVLGFQTRTLDFYNPKLAEKNIRDHVRSTTNISIHHGTIKDRELLGRIDSRLWNMMIFSSTDYPGDFLDYLWMKLDHDAIMVFDRLHTDTNTNKAFDELCRRKNRDGVVFNTKYGIGIVQK